MHSITSGAVHISREMHHVSFPAVIERGPSMRCPDHACARVCMSKRACAFMFTRLSDTSLSAQVRREEPVTTLTQEQAGVARL